MATSTDALARRIARLERNLKRVSNQPQLGYSSFEGGAIEEYDPASELLVQRIGQQFDGTHTTAQFNGPPPPTPANFTLEALAGSVRVNWDGDFEPDLNGNPVYAPMDFARVEVHVSTMPEFDTNQTTTLMTTFDTPRGGSKDIAIREPGVQYVRLVARNQSGTRSTDSVTQEIEVGWELIVPPTTTPVAQVVGGIGTLQVLWPVTLNPSGYTVEVHVTDTDAVPVQGDLLTLAETTTGTMVVLSTMPDGSPLVPGIDYHVWLYAVNNQGSAPIRGPFTGQLRQINTPDIAVDAAWVGTMSVDNLSGGTLRGETIVGSGGGIYAEGTNGEKVGIWPSGFKVSGGAGTNFKTFVDFPTTGAPNIVSGVLRATTLEVDSDPVTGRALNLRGRSELAQGAELRMTSAVSPPIAGPIVTDFYPTTQINWGTAPVPASLSSLRGGYWDPVDNHYYFIDPVPGVVYRVDTAGVVQGYISLAGKLPWDAITGAPVAYGITRANGQWHILHTTYRQTAERGVALTLEALGAVTRFDGAWNPTGTWYPRSLSYAMTKYSGIGRDMADNVIIASRQTNNDLWAIHYLPTVPAGQNGGDSVQVSRVVPMGAGGWDNNGPIRSVTGERSDLPSGRVLVAQTKRVISVAQSGRVTADEFPLEADTSAGVWWAGVGTTGSFYSLSTTGSVTQYAAPAPAGTKAHFASTRYSAAGYETDIGPLTSHTGAQRAFLKVTVSYAGSPGARLYGAMASFVPARTGLYLQQTFLEPNDTYIFGSALVATGSTPPGPNDRPFPNSNPAQIVSTDGSTYWKANGTALLRELQVTSGEDVTALAGNAPALRVGDPNGWQMRLDGNQIQAMTDDAHVKTLSLNIEADASGNAGGLELGRGARIFKYIRMGSTSVTTDANGLDTIAHGGTTTPSVVVASKRRAGPNGSVETRDYGATTFTVGLTGHTGTPFAAGDSTTIDWIAIWI